MSEPILRPAPPGGVPFRLKVDPSAPARSVLMLHGWSGDENVMWVLETVLPETRIVAAPRGLYPLRSGGYQWVEGDGGLTSSLSDFAAGVDSILAVLDELAGTEGLDPADLIMMGFSQGAALAFAVLESGRIHPRAIVCLAGFVPQGALGSLDGMEIFWGHGIRDELVPIERAHRDLERLERAGAHVNFCEADVGHRLGIECTRGLKGWIQRLAR
jgi:phospholipase/carboxylesterase